MSWPHILSFSRVLAGPVIAALVLAPPGDAYLIAAVLFSLASITDLLDGQLARHSQRVSHLGVFLDTTADKIMVALVVVALSLAGLVAAWVPLTILAREFFITGLRSYAATRNRVISAHIWGKGKAALTMVAAGLLLFAADGRAGGLFSHVFNHAFWQHAVTGCVILLDISAALTIVSGLRYVVDAWPLLRDENAEAAEAPRRLAAGNER